MGSKGDLSQLAQKFLKRKEELEQQAAALESQGRQAYHISFFSTVNNNSELSANMV